MKNITLGAGMTVILNKRGTLKCRQGCLWITWPGSEDKILHEHDEIILRSGSGKTVIQNLSSDNALIQI